MTISDNYTPDKSIGDGSTTDFSGSWSVLSASYFRLYLETIATGAQDLQELDVDYTLSFDDDGYVATMVVPPTSSYNVIRARDVAQEQNVPYKTSKGFQGIVQEGSFDKLTAMDQDQQDQINRSLTFPIGSTAVGSIPEPVDDKPIGWDGVSGSVKNGSMTLTDIQGAIDAVAALSAASGVKVSSNDTTVGFLNGKLVAGTNISFVENNDGGDETLTINNSSPAPVFPIPRNFIDGFQMSTAGASATMTIGEGQCSDSTNAVLIEGSSIAKTTSAWAVGTGDGGLDTGTIANDTWYHFYAIRRPDTGVVDALISLSATSPTLPTNYTQFRRIGSGRTNGSAQWVRFIQNGDDFDWFDTVLDVNANAPTTSAVTRTLSVPPISGITAKIQAGIYNSSTSGLNVGLIVNSLDVAEETPTVYSAGTPNSDISGGVVSTTVVTRQVVVKNVRTSALGEVRTKSFTGGAETTLTIRTTGWIDRRGKE